MRNPDAITIDALVTALYETISGPAGPRDWERERRLFAPRAILFPAGPIPGGAGGRATAAAAGHGILDLEGYIASRSAYFAANELFETETARQTFQFGNIAHVLSAYAVRRRPEDEQTIWRGINSIQLFHDGARWWVVSILWDNARADAPLPQWAEPG
jgi:hypothetical protein